MKPLQTCRRAFNRICGKHFAAADDNELVTSHRQRLIQKTFSIFFVTIFITIVTFHMRTFMELQLNDPEELFFVLLQIIMTVQTSCTFITICSCCSRISTVFQKLAEIYENCKQIDSRNWTKIWNSIKNFRSRRTINRTQWKAWTIRWIFP